MTRSPANVHNEPQEPQGLEDRTTALAMRQVGDEWWGLVGLTRRVFEDVTVFVYRFEMDGRVAFALSLDRKTVPA